MTSGLEESLRVFDESVPRVNIGHRRVEPYLRGFLPGKTQTRRHSYMHES